MFTDRTYYYKNPEKAFRYLSLGLLISSAFGGATFLAQVRDGREYAGLKLFAFSLTLILLWALLRAVFFRSYIDLTVDDRSLVIVDKTFPFRNWREDIPKADIREMRLVDTRLFPNFIDVKWKERRVVSVRAQDLAGMLTETRLVELELNSGRKLLLDPSDTTAFMTAFQGPSSV